MSSIMKNKLSLNDIENKYESMQEYSIPDVAFRGISIKQLKEIYSEIEVRCEIEGWVNNNGILLTPDKVCLYDIIDRIIKARSERYQCSYVELIAIGSQKPTRFVSHWWGEPVISMIRCLEQHCIDHDLSEETSYYWICAYANNQHKINDEMLTNPFLKAMSICEGTISIMDPNCKIYTRIWCIYELYKSVMENDRKCEFDIYTETDSNEAVGITHGFLSSDYKRGDDIKSFVKKIRESKYPIDRILKSINVNVKDAESSIESDRKYIFNIISGKSKSTYKICDEDTNCENLNNILRGIFITPIIDRIIKEKDINIINQCIHILKLSNSRIINIDVRDCKKFDDSLLHDLIENLPFKTIIDLTLMLHGSNVTKEGIQSCYQKFEDFKLIENLDLSFCNINDDIIKIIIENMLIHYQKLKKLNVSYNNISNIGLIEIAKGLKFNSSLVSLDLSGNKIKYNNNNMSSTCCLMKGKFMLYFDQLQISINNILIWSSLLSKNKEKYDGITELTYAIENHPNLLSLNLSATNITYNDIKTIAVSLKHNYILQYLDLSENNINDAGVIEIANALRVNNTLKSLNLSCNLISDEGVSELVDSLKINYNLTSLFLSENNIGDDGDEYLTILTQELEESNRIINITWW